MYTTSAEYGAITLHHTHTAGQSSTTHAIALQVGEDVRNVPEDRWAEVQEAAMSTDPPVEETLQAIYDTL